MNESTYAAMREFIKVAVELEVGKRMVDVRAALPVEPRAVVAGPPGKDGRDGTNGIDGKDGTDGRDGAPGEPGARGADGVSGRDGSPGKDGTPGAKGERGADGIATRAELESIVEARFAELQVRSLADSWRGVWTPDTTYQRGNVAQWDGSPWLALKDNTAKPGTSNDWVLFAKKGRDGSRTNGR